MTRKELLESSHIDADTHDDSDAGCEEEEDPTDENYSPEEKKIKFDFNEFGGKLNDDMPPDIVILVLD